MLEIVQCVLYAVYLVGFLWLIKKLAFFNTVKTADRQWEFFFLLKVIAGVVLTLTYTFYYTSHNRVDIYRYFNDSRIIADILWQNPKAWLNIMLGINLNDPETFGYLVKTQNFSHPADDFATNNTFIIRANVLLNYLSFQNIFINTLFFTFFSFCGLVALYKTLTHEFHLNRQLLLLPFFLFPSLIFWSSGLLKESLFYGAFGFWFLSYVRIQKNKFTVKHFTALLIFSFIILSVKAQVFILLLIAAYWYFTAEKSGHLKWLLLSAPFVIVGLTAIVKPEIIHVVIETILTKRNEFVSLALEVNSGSLLHSEIVRTDGITFFTLLPLAFIDALFSPFVFSGENFLQLVFALENFLFAGSIAFILSKFKKPTGSQRSLLVFCLAFAVTNLLVIGITAPIVGAIVHYRIVATPFLLVGAICCSKR